MSLFPVPQLPAADDVKAEMRAGKLTRGADGLTMTPDPRKGLVRLIVGPDGLTHFQWLERTTGAPPRLVDDVIVFPEEARWEPVAGPPRVYALQFMGQPTRDALYWIQEPKADGDAELCDRINAALGQAVTRGRPGAVNGPTLAAAAARSAAAAAASIGHTPGAPPPSSTPVGARLPPATTPHAPGPHAAAPAAPPSAGLAALRDLLSSIAVPGGPTVPGMPAGPGRPPAREGPSLADVLSPESLLPLLADAAVADRLAEHLPEGHRSPADLRELVQSVQFRQQVETFSTALTSGQVDLAQFGLAPGGGFSVADFLEAINRAAGSKPGDDSKPMER